MTKTGIHMTHGKGRACEGTGKWCDVCKEYKRSKERRQSHTPGTYRYKMCHGLDKPGEKRRERERQAAKVPGTYVYLRKHGLGRPGEKNRESANRLSRTPGTYAYMQAHRLGRPGLIVQRLRVRKRLRHKELLLKEMVV
jgi:hypothetical protein